MTRLVAFVACVGLVLPTLARAQDQVAPPEEPDREWGDFPGKEQPKPPPRRPVFPGEDWGPAIPGPQLAPYPRAPEPEPLPEPQLPNHISMLGAHPLGKWVRGQSVLVGFPLVQIRVALGLANRFDVAIGFDSMYGTLNEPRLAARWTPLLGEVWALAFQVEAGAAFFSARSQAEGYGPRWFTGRRNFNIQPGLTVSFQRSHPRAARLFLQAYYLLALDTEPYQRTPLGGTPLGVQPGHNVGLKFGTELPLSSYTSLVFHLGAEVHLRDGDSPVMPSAGLGLVTSI